MTERQPSGAMPSPDSADTMARLHDALTTLEWMLDEQGAPAAAAPAPATPAPAAPAPAAPVPAARAAAPASGREAAAAAESVRPDGGVRKPPNPDSLPLLDEVVKPAAGPAGANGAAAAAPPPPLPFPGLAEADVPEPAAAGVPFVLEEPASEAGGAPPAPRLSEVRLGERAGSGGERYGDVPPPPLDPVAYRHLVERLANEIDVIVQAGTEEALARAAADAAGKVRRHVELMLPEIVEELARMGGRSRD